MKFGFYQRPTAFLILVIVASTVLITVVLLTAVIPALSPFLGTLKTNELIAVCAVVATMIGITVQLILYGLNLRRAQKSRLELDVATHGTLARITCSFENTGMKRIIPKNVYLFVDQGKEKQGVLCFPFMLRHETGENDCVLSKRCKAGGLVEFPHELRDKDEFANEYSHLVFLKHLSSESILFVDPGEKFSEDAVLRLPKAGVYRATVVFTATNADCTCATRQFILDEEKK